MCYPIIISNQLKGKIMTTITSPKFTQNIMASTWEDLRDEVVDLLELPVGTDIRIAPNAITLHAKMGGTWSAVMNGSINEMKDWALLHDYKLKMSITL